MTQLNCLHFGGFFAFEAFSPPTFSVVLSFTYLDFFSQIKWVQYQAFFTTSIGSFSFIHYMIPSFTLLVSHSFRCLPHALSFFSN